jgi:hypothetical protein
MRVDEWAWTSWSMPSHAVACLCVCYRCVWKRVHAQFWRDVPCMPNSDSDTCDSQGSGEGGDAARAPFIVQESLIVSGTQPSQQPFTHAPHNDPLPGLPDASIPPGTRTAAHDRLKPAFACTFPNLHRVFDKVSSKAIAHVAWQFASPHEIWSIATSPFLGSGSKKTMTWYKIESTKFVHELLGRALPAANSANSPSAVAWTGLIAKSHMEWTFPEFNLACSHPSVLTPLRTRLQTYNKTKVIFIKNGLFEDATSVQIDKCRLAALMVEPLMFAYLAAKSNPPQSREHTDNPQVTCFCFKFFISICYLLHLQLRAVYINELCMKEMTRLHNDALFVPAANADITSWAPDFFVNTGQPAEARDYGWICTEFTHLKTEMGTLMSRFNQSGNLENEADDSARDARFWNQFCKKQPLYMYLYMLWDHGRDSRYAWNAILLPEDQRMDFGLHAEADFTSPPPLPTLPTAQPPTSQSTVKGRKRAHAQVHIDTSTDANLLQISTHLLQQFQQAPNQGRDTDTSTQESRNADKAKALSDHADLINHQLTKLPDDCSGMRANLLATLEAIIKQLCDITGGQ